MLITNFIYFLFYFFYFCAGLVKLMHISNHHGWRSCVMSFN